MASLIPAEVMAQMLARRGQVQTVNTGGGNVMPPSPPMQGMNNPSMQLQTAHNQAVQRGQTSTPSSGPGNRGPMTSSVYKSLMIDAAGLDDHEKEDYKQVAQDSTTTPQQLTNLLQMRAKTRAAGVGQQQQPNPQAGQMSIQAKGKPAQQFQGTAPQPQADPATQMIQQFKGQIPDQLLQAGASAIQAGAKPEQIFSHFQNAIQHQQQMHMTQAHQEAMQSQHQRDQVTKAHPEIDFDGDESQFVGNDAETMKSKMLYQQVKGMQQPQPQQQQQQPQQQQVPQPPKPGHPLDAQNAQHFLQMAGGDKNKARQLAKQSGWGF